MQAAEEGHDVEELMERAGRAVADEVLTRFPAAGRSPPCAAAEQTAATDASRPSSCARAAGRSGRVGDADVVIDALFGTGFHGAPREDAAQQIGR